MEEVFKRAMFLEINDYPRDYRDCVRQAISELKNPNEMIDLCNIFGIDTETYIHDMCECYLRHKSQQVSKMWRNSAS